MKNRLSRRIFAGIPVWRINYHIQNRWFLVKSGLISLGSFLSIVLLIGTIWSLPSATVCNSGFAVSHGAEGVAVTEAVVVKEVAGQSEAPDKLEAGKGSCHDCTGKPVAPLTIKIQVPSDISLTETFVIKATVSSPSDWKNASLTIDTGDALVVHSGDLQWKGVLAANVAAETSVVVSFAGADGDTVGAVEIGAERATVAATGGLSFKNGTKLFKAVEQVIVPAGVLVKSTSSIKTVAAQTLPGIIEVMGVER